MSYTEIILSRGEELVHGVRSGRDEGCKQILKSVDEPNTNEKKERTHESDAADEAALGVALQGRTCGSVTEQNSAVPGEGRTLSGSPVVYPMVYKTRPAVHTPTSCAANVGIDREVMRDLFKSQVRNTSARNGRGDIQDDDVRETLEGVQVGA